MSKFREQKDLAPWSQVVVEVSFLEDEPLVIVLIKVRFEMSTGGDIKKKRGRHWSGQTVRTIKKDTIIHLVLINDY